MASGAPPSELDPFSRLEDPEMAAADAMLASAQQDDQAGAAIGTAWSGSGKSGPPGTNLQMGIPVDPDLQHQVQVYDD